MTAPSVLRIPKYYDDPAGNREASAALERDAWMAYDLAHIGTPETQEEAQKILLDWALHCSAVEGEEASLVLTVKGSLFMEAWLLMKDLDWNKGVFPPWVGTILRPCAVSFWGEENNQGAWSILSTALIAKVLDLGPAHEDHIHQRIYEFVQRAIAPDGTAKIEVLRTNSALWYWYFMLAPLLRACQVTNHLATVMIQRSLEKLYWYCHNCDPWPFPPERGVWRWFPALQQKIHPHAAEPELPRRDDWTGSLFAAAGAHFDRPEWLAYAEPIWNNPPFPGVNVFRWGV